MPVTTYKTRGAAGWTSAVAKVKKKQTIAPAITQIIFDGQSFNNAPADPNNYRSILVTLLSTTWYPSADIVNAGVNGTTYAQRTTDVATRVDSHISGSHQCLILDVGAVSDLYPVSAGGSAFTAAQALSAIETYMGNRRTAGVDIIIPFTVTPATGFDSPQEAQRVAYNSLLKASSHFEAVCDMASLPHAQVFSNTTYFSDGLHPTPALAAEIAALAKTTMQSIGLP